MSRKNLKKTDWDEIAAKQFKSLNKDIQDDWGDLRQVTLQHN